MKKCLRCGQGYTDDTLNFCLNDGELLVKDADFEGPPTRYSDESPPTLLMDQPRVTNPIDWPQSSPVRWPNQASTPATNQYGVAGHATAAPNQTLPTISLILGIISVFMVCCAGGIYIGLPAAIVGFIGLKNADSDPSRFGGRGMAIGGMVLGTITFLASFFLLIFGQLS